MTSKKNNAAAAAKPAAVHVSQSAIVTDFVLSMQALQKALNLGEPLEDAERRNLLPGLRYRDRVIDLAASAVDTHGAILPVKFDSKSAREAVALHNSIQPALTAGEELLQRLADYALAPRARAGKQAALVYKVARAIAETEEGKPLRKMVKAMARAMKHKKPSTKERKAGTPSTPPAPAARTTEKTTERVTEMAGS